MKKIKPTEVQLKIIQDIEGSIVVTAGAGTGKTGVLVEKIQYELENKQCDYKTIAGITFTIKAANEIKERLNIQDDDIFIGTNNAFVIQEVVSPFMWDVYGKNYRHDFDTNYMYKVNIFQEGIDYIKEKKAICSYTDSKHNFVFELALDILKKSTAAQCYLKSKYFKLFIDEYQDCDKSMNEFFMYLKNVLNIKLFIVGDNKQSIYIWRGAAPELFDNLLKDKSFKSYELNQNFRCAKQIQNLSNILYDKTKNLYEPCDDKSSVVLVNYNNGDIITAINNSFEKKLHTAILSRTRNSALNYANELNKLGNDFVFVPQLPIDELTSKDSWIYRAIADYYFTRNVYNFFDFISVESIDRDSLIKEIKDSVVKKILDLYDCVSNKEIFYQKLESFATGFECECNKDISNLLIKTISDSENKIAFYNINNKNQSMTLHSSKGKEFQQVVIFAEDFNQADTSPECLNLLYVAITRAKNKLIIITPNFDNNFMTKVLKVRFEVKNIKGSDIFSVINIKKED